MVSFLKRNNPIGITPSVDIHVATHNDELYIDHFCKWYKHRFPGANIYVYDNYSTDRTREKAFENKCTFISFGNPEFHDENALTYLKNSCFLGGISDYFIICDVDELIDLNAIELARIKPTFVQGRGWQAVNVDNNSFESIRHGVRDTAYDKFLCFRREQVLEVNYSNGAHRCSPKLSPTATRVRLLRRNLFHFRWLSLNHVLKRFYDRSARVKLNSENYSVLKKWHYDISESELKSEFKEMTDRATPIKITWEASRLKTSTGIRYWVEVWIFFTKALKVGYFQKTLRLIRHELISALVGTKRRFFYQPWSFKK